MEPTACQPCCVSREPEKRAAAATPARWQPPVGRVG